MYILVFVIIIVAILIKFSINNKNKKQIEAFENAINKAKEGFISNVQIQEIKKAFEPTFKHLLRKSHKSKKDLLFIATYTSLESKANDWNEEYRAKQALKEKEEAEKRKIQEMYSYQINLSDKFLKKIEELKKDYFTTNQRDELLKEYKPLYDYFQTNYFIDLNLNAHEKFINTYTNLKKLTTTWNFEFVRKEIELNDMFFNDIDGKSLDYQQRTAVVTDDTHNLILAGAGSGKTLTISAKVKYLIEKKNIRPEEILLISFTKKAADEMTERINNKLNIPVTAVTFHKLGLDILKNYQMPTIIDNTKKILSNYFNKEVLKDYTALKNIFDFFLYYLNVPKNLQDFDCLGSYIDSQRSIDLETLKSKYDANLLQVQIHNMKKNLQTISGEHVRSMEEVMIANYLFLNGINYEYEKEYPYKSEEQPERSYHPDFYLSDYDIYLEHFGITKDNKLPWLPEVEEKRYLEEMQWKREFHKQNGTKLIETYSYYNQEHRLLEELQKLLDDNKIEIHPRNIKEVYEAVYSNHENMQFNEFENLVSTFIQLYKANGYSIDDLNKLRTIPNNYQSQRNNAFLDIIQSIMEYYQQQLNEMNGIDFADMINFATNYIKENDISFDYKYIIIDEYQDISIGRYKLIKQILEHSNAKLICVGDDWQSIYRFSGSDLDLFSNFEKYFGETALLKIEKTYRNSQELLDIATKFIEKNPEQLKKNLVSDKRIKEPIMVMAYATNKKLALNNALTDIYMHFGEDAEVLLLGRTNYDLNDYMDDDLKYFPNTNIVTYSKYPKMNIKFLTVHSSKGLEADNVIIINMENSLLGFPNKISDDAVLSMVLQNKDAYEYAEERRLFYVAITRTRNKTYLIAPDKHASIFLDDLKSITNLSVYMNENEESIQSNPNCPKCKKGFLIIRNDEKKPFLGCSNYPYCNYKIKDIDVLNTRIKCNVCGGYLVRRNGPYGEFFGCSNYPYCTNTGEKE
ncbi:MAG: UvrD-helicase domain-containing protein [Clostridia bacterium]|nr:UvrD-helicase domain-containing protein [Clostridia bacterium]